MQTKLLMLIVLAAAVSASAQVRVESNVMTRNGDVIFERHVAGPGQVAEFSGHTFEFLAPMASFEKTVKGAPYSAEAVNESVQILTDGNRIRRTSTTTLYRDAEGRTRRDQSLGAIGPWASSGDAPRLSFINDPVAGVTYILDHNRKTARKVTGALSVATGGAVIADSHAAAGGVGGGTASARVYTYSRTESGTTHTRTSSPFETSTEQLGKQNIEGVDADGTRNITTIPAGQIGNEQPIRIVNERWFSPDLQTIVMSKRTDPQFGETTYRLTRLSRADQPRSLFEVPSDYTITEENQLRRTTPAQTY